MTLGFALTTALGLLALVGTTLHLDDVARDRDLLQDLAGRSETLTRAVGVEPDGSLDLTAFEQAVDEDRPQAWAVLSNGVLLVAGPDQQAVPSDAELARIAATARVRTDQPAFRADDAAGRSLLWIAAAVPPGPGLDPAPGSVVLVGGTAPRAAAHDELAQQLLLAVALLTLLAASAGHLISGRAMRTAVVALDQQEQFLTEAAHELRTPLATLRLLLEDPAPEPEDRAAERRQAERLERLVESLLLRARAEASGTRPALTPLRLDQLADRVADEAGPVERDLEPTVVSGAPHVLAVAVRNLLENARRHGGGEVRLVVRDRALEVADRGPGIPEERRAAVLRRGVTGGGTGTGLALVAWAAEVHDARLDLLDTPGGGLTVRLRFPASSPPHDPARTVEA